MKYRIKSLKELRFEFSNHDSDEINDSNLILNTSFKESFDFEQNEISIFLHCVYGIKDEDTARQVLHSDIIMIFGFEKFPNSKTKRKHYIQEILPSLLGIAISSMRGIIYSRTKGEPINEYVLPIINPTQLISDRIKSEPLQIA